MEEPLYKMRKATPADKRLLFDWANEEEVRKNSINSRKISFEEHEVWFDKKINSPGCVIFILEMNGRPVGVVRFEFNEEEKAWEIGYSIELNFRGMGLGKIIINKGIHLLNHYPVIGYVKEENRKSQAIFNSLGFINDGRHVVKNCPLLRFVKKSAS